MSMRVTHRQSGTALQRRRLGRELRRLRREAGLSLVDVGKVLYRSPATISRIERGQVGVTPRDVREMLRRYGVEDQRPDLVRLAEEAHRRDAFSQAYGDMPAVYRTFLELERSAVSVTQYEGQVVPGLLQTEDYASALTRAIFPRATAEQVERHVEVRLGRQALLGHDDPPRFEAVIDEGVLHRLVGGGEVMLAQLAHLADAAELPNVSLQVIPFEAGEHGGMAGSFTILTFGDPADRDELYFEYSAGERLTSSPTEVGRHVQLFAALRHAALPAGETAAFIRALAARMRSA